MSGAAGDAPAFTVVVPTYGRPVFVAEALASVAAQTVADFECIVVDDASPSPFDIELPDARFRLVRRYVNGGPAAARNTGLRAARGEAVVFLDDDDLFTPARLEIAAAGLARAPVALCSSGSVGSNAVIHPRFEGDVHDVILDTTTPHIGTVAVRRADCPEFDEAYRACEDLDWWLRTTARRRVTSDERVGWLWRRHSGARPLHGDETRIEGSVRLLEAHADYFAGHRRAAAFRWFRIGLLARATGQAGLRRKAAWRVARHDRRPVMLARAARLLV